MNNKGFTLIEIIAVVGLLALIGVMVGTNLTSMNQQQNDKNYRTYKSTIAEGACMFFESKDMIFYSTKDGALDKDSTYRKTREQCLTLSTKTCYVTTEELLEYGYIDENLKDPTTQDSVTTTEVACVKYKNGMKSCYYGDEC